ncbi:hypothetical protein AQUCO_11600005v1 [Aquilegia coerulea]|nr:hypothetical protein AQUCO_11600005v1 [Aquilegia coerulea]
MFPHGNMGWPIIGETLEFLKLGRKGIPEKFINDRMQKFSSKVFKTSLFGETMVVLCGPEGNKFLFSNENTLVKGWVPGSIRKIIPSAGNVSTNEGAIKMRKKLQTSFKLETLQKFIGKMDLAAKEHLTTHWDNKKEVLVFPLAKNYGFSLVCQLFMSLDDHVEAAKFYDHFAVLLAGLISIPIDLPGTSLHKAIGASNILRKYIAEIVRQRKLDIAERVESVPQDILSHMLLTSDENGQFLNDMEIADRIVGLLVAGHDTVSAAITFIVKYLAELPHIYEEVQNEQREILRSKPKGELLNWEDISRMKYSWNVAREAMRLASPAQGFFREAITNFTYAGFSIQKGWKIYWSTYSTHKDPNYFPNPETFDPSRFEGNGPAPYTYIPFGGGPHMCPGNVYARLVILVFMHNVVTRFKWEKIFADERIIIDPLPKPAKGLPIRLQPQCT